VNEAPVRIDEIHARAESVEGIDECRDFAGLELEHPADQDGTPDVRSDQSHLPARPLIDKAVPLVAEHAEYRRAERRPVENRADEVDQALRLRPLTIQFGLAEFAKRDQVGGRNRLLDVSEKMRLCGGIDRFEQGDRQPLESELMLGNGVVGTDILVDERSPGPADEIGRPFDGALPKGRVDGGIVDDADQVAQSLLIVGAACRRKKRDRSRT
jgi:hypothetical protein